MSENVCEVTSSDADRSETWCLLQCLLYSRFTLDFLKCILCVADAYTAKKKAGQEPQPDDLVKEVRSFGRSTVPDAVKAELLAELRDFIA